MLITIITSLFFASVLFIFFSKYSIWLDILRKTRKRDLRALRRFAKLNWLLWNCQRQEMTVAKRFSFITRKNPEKVAFYYEDDIWTYSQVDEVTTKIGNYFKNEGFKKGDTVSLFMDSRPEYVCLWLGLSKIGVVTALINTNLIRDPLVHCIQVAQSKALIFGSALSETISDVSEKLKDLKLYQFHESNNEQYTKAILNGSIDLRLQLEKNKLFETIEDLEDGKPVDKLLFIYTSGTTGFPKAAVITNLRYFVLTMGVYSMTGLSENDIIYDPLPLYHSSGGILGMGQCLLNGLTITLRKKFSASNYWKDCIKYKCTAAQYIGEICRYILLTNNNNNDEDCVKHSIKKIFGNGLRPQIWTQFVDKFNIKEVYEFYGATEGISSLSKSLENISNFLLKFYGLVNIDSTPGAIGFVPRLCNFVYPVILVKCDTRSGEPLRKSNGYCIACEPNEPGVLLGKINPKKAIFAFAGYADQKATEKKIVRNAFKKGDIYFNSGDILEYDELGYYYFKDRTGDTFRWKGENVSTTEIEAVISNITDLRDCVVYGVEVSNSEGRAGMLAIVDENGSINMTELAKNLKTHLPSYAIPIFVRVIRSVSMTGTYKLKKTELQAEGYDLIKVSPDKLFFYNSKDAQYVEFNTGFYEKLKSGQLQL